MDKNPNQCYKPHELVLNDKERSAINNEIVRLQSIGVIVPSQPEKKEFLPTVFARHKKDGAYDDPKPS